MDICSSIIHENIHKITKKAKFYSYKAFYEYILCILYIIDMFSRIRNLSFINFKIINTFESELWLF